MATVTNMSQLEKILQRQLQRAMTVAANEMLAETYGNVYEFYTEGNPEEYERTGALGDTPRITPMTNAGNSISFDIYLDDTHQYTTGTFSMGEVLQAAEDHTAGILGKPHFWEKSEQDIEKTLGDTINKFF